jgi:hypothetical protein
MSNLPGPAVRAARADLHRSAATAIRRTDAIALTLAVALLAATFLAALTGAAEARTIGVGKSAVVGGTQARTAGAERSTTDGGGAVAGTPLSKLTAHGAKARLTSTGLAIPPAAAPPRVQAAIRAGNRIAKKPYKWGGGHAILNDSGYDCSGSVSFALRGGRLMTSSMASTGFMSWGRRGKGRWITIRANSGHVYMVIAGLRFDTSARGIGGSRWTAQMRSPHGYVATHPPGF